MCHNTIMHRAETVVLKLRSPSKAKRAWLDQTAERFRQGCSWVSMLP